VPGADAAAAGGHVESNTPTTPTLAHAERSTPIKLQWRTGEGQKCDVVEIKVRPMRVPMKPIINCHRHLLTRGAGMRWFGEQGEANARADKTHHHHHHQHHLTSQECVVMTVLLWGPGKGCDQVLLQACAFNP